MLYQCIEPAGVSAIVQQNGRRSVLGGHSGLRFAKFG